MDIGIKLDCENKTFHWDGLEVKMRTKGFWRPFTPEDTIYAIHEVSNRVTAWEDDRQL